MAFNEPHLTKTPIFWASYSLLLILEYYEDAFSTVPNVLTSLLSS